MKEYQQNLTEIFEKQEYPKNLILFKKIILLARQGLLQVNGQFPNESKTLFENLIEGHSFLIDLTQLDSDYRYKLKTWLLDPHENECNYTFWEGYINNDYRGYTIEVPLSWWGRVCNWFWGSIETAFWPLATLDKLKTGFQLFGFTLQKGKQAWLFEFKSTHLEKKFSFKKNPIDLEQARNSRRIVLTPGIVDKLVLVQEVDERIFSELNEPHPLSIKVLSHQKEYRHKKMEEFRKVELIEEDLPWYLNVWEWAYQLVSSLFSKIRLLFFPQPVEKIIRNKIKPQQEHVENTKIVLFENERIKITKQCGVYQVREIWSGYKNLVCSGGGAKIFSLLGGYRACREMEIPFSSFAGSSAGAIVSILAYLDYDSGMIENFFTYFNREILLFNEWDSSGYSKTTALKAGFDYVISLKVQEIIKKYEINKTNEGCRFLDNEVFRKGKITMRSLDKLKQRYPNCGLGENLVITGSNLETQRTTYFSLKTTPDVELSLAGAASSGIPPFFKPTLWKGVPHTDGGLTSNFPSEAFIGHDKSFLCSKYGYNLESLGFWFDTGSEETMLNHFRKQIYRESKLSNWFYRLLSGIKDPASSWEWDRIKLVQQSFTTVLLHSDVASTRFTIPQKKQKELIDKGYEETKRHLNYLYVKDKKNGAYKPSQIMFENFQSMAEILVHCCFRQNKELFDELAPIAKQHGVDQKKIDLLARRFDLPYYPSQKSDLHALPESCIYTSEISPPLSNLLRPIKYTDRMHLFTYLYPIFLRLRLPMFATKKDYKIFCKARHGMDINNPLYVTSLLKDLSPNQHLVLYIITYCLKSFQKNNSKDVFLILKNISDAVIAKKLDMKLIDFVNEWSMKLSKDDLFNQALDAVRKKDWLLLVKIVKLTTKVQNHFEGIKKEVAKPKNDGSMTNLLGRIVSYVY